MKRPPVPVRVMVLVGAASLLVATVCSKQQAAEEPAPPTEQQPLEEHPPVPEDKPLEPDAAAPPGDSPAYFPATKSGGRF